MLIRQVVCDKTTENKQQPRNDRKKEGDERQRKREGDREKKW